MDGKYDKQGYLMGSDSEPVTVEKQHAVRVTLDDHEYNCLAQEAKQNHRAPNREITHQLSMRYKKTQLKGAKDHE